MDGLTLDQAISLVSHTRDKLWAVKLHNLFDRYGAEAIRALRSAGAERLWVDAKLHDIPGTVLARATAIAECGANIITVHASGQVEMMQAAKKSGLMIFGVTVLTSLDDELGKAVYGDSPSVVVPKLADLIVEAGLDGIVCSAKEVGSLVHITQDTSLKLIVPGTRSPGKKMGDQKRSTTPAEAIQAGATHLVVASQVTGSSDPVGELQVIEEEIAAVQ
ncbi:MAG: orotidine-5'-phosphate decarboxylase [Anaplasmataceae bacterium]|nr:orotidine-5'-phosphate decarboxylase [Anaplasmataceae bacterium]